MKVLSEIFHVNKREMDQISNGQPRSREKLWVKTESADIESMESTAYFYIKSEDGSTVIVQQSLTPIDNSAIEEESESVDIKSEITIGGYNDIPSSDVLQLTNDEKRNIERQERIFSCDECGATFVRKWILEKHRLKQHHAETEPKTMSSNYKIAFVDVGKIPTSQQLTSNEYKKSGCRTSYLALEAHTDEKLLACDEINLDGRDQETEITESQSLKVHQKIHTCEQCGKDFNRKDSLKRHVLIHSGERPFACDECELRFAQKFNLESHKLTHKGDKPFHCDSCGMKFAQKSYLKHHKLTHDEKQFHCDECGAKFAQKYTLTRHKLTHSGQKHFHCDECGKRFGRKIQLRTHKLIHTGERPFGCNQCHKKFRTRSTLTEHIVKQHRKIINSTKQ